MLPRTEVDNVPNIREMTKVLRATAHGRSSNITQVRWDARTLIEGRKQLTKLDRFQLSMQRKRNRGSAPPLPVMMTEEIEMTEDVILDVLYRYGLLKG